MKSWERCKGAVPHLRPPPPHTSWGQAINRRAGCLSRRSDDFDHLDEPLRRAEPLGLWNGGAVHCTRHGLSSKRGPVRAWSLLAPLQGQRPISVPPARPPRAPLSSQIGAYFSLSPARMSVTRGPDGAEPEGLGDGLPRSPSDEPVSEASVRGRAGMFLQRLD